MQRRLIPRRRRMVRVGPRLWALGALVASLAACATENPGIDPDRDRLYFPTGVALDPVRDILFVSNGNADLRFNGATVMALDLARLPDDLRATGRRLPRECRPDPIEADRWICEERGFVQPWATIRIGRPGAGDALQGDFPGGVRLSPDRKRLFTPVRGAGFLLWVDVASAGGRRVDLRCHADCDGAGGSDCGQWECDRAHQVRFSQRLQRQMPGEPFGIALRRPVAGVAADHIFLAHLRGGEVSFLVSDAGGVRLVDTRSGVFPARRGIILGADALALAPAGALALPAAGAAARCRSLAQWRADAARACGTDPLAELVPGAACGAGRTLGVRYACGVTSPVFVASRTSALVPAVAVRSGARLVPTREITLQALNPGTDVRGLALSPRGDRLYLVTRRPPALTALDLRPDRGRPADRPLWVAEACPGASLLRLGPDPAVAGSAADALAYVVCFDAAQIYVIETRLGRLVAQISTGAGPHELALDARRKRAFVANFLENTVGVVDLDPSSPAYRRMVVRIGAPEALQVK